MGLRMYRPDSRHLVKLQSLLPALAVVTTALLVCLSPRVVRPDAAPQTRSIPGRPRWRWQATGSGDVVAKASLSPAETKLLATYRFDEFGNPVAGGAGRFGWSRTGRLNLQNVNDASSARSKKR